MEGASNTNLIDNSPEDLGGAKQCPVLDNASGTPKVFIRMTRSMDETYYAMEGKKTLLLKPIKSHRVKPMSKAKMRHFSFNCENVLYKVGQEETFKTVALEMTDRAMMGKSGILLSIGTLNSGKSYSLFGDAQNLGIIHKVIERIDHNIQNKCFEFTYKFSLSFIDIENNVVRDCLSGGKVVDIEQAKRKSFKTVLGAVMIIMKALGSIKTKCNTIVYIYIDGEHPEYSDSVSSKITLAELASTIPREVSPTDPSPMTVNGIQELMREIMKVGFETACVEANEPIFTPIKAVSPYGNVHLENDRTEDIPIRKDLYLLEDMFMTFAKKTKEQRYFEELKALGLSGKMQRPKFMHKIFFNSSKLAVALSDLLSGNCNIRILAHLIPRGEFTYENLKVLRFAVRASILPTQLT